MALIEINKNNFDLEIELRYSSKNNITGRKIFKEGKCFLHNVAAEKLNLAIKIAYDFDCKLKIFDAYRPQYVQEELWKSLVRSGTVPVEECFMDKLCVNPQTK